MKNKGFTLIELLAVITVLGIVMVIAVTAVSGVIDDSKKKSFMGSAMLIAKQIREEVLSYDYKNNTSIDCLQGNYGLSLYDYQLCTANISNNNDNTKVYIDLVGKGNFSGLAIIGATMDNANIINDSTYQSLKEVLLGTLGTKDVDVNKYDGNGLYKWGNKYIFRGGVTKTNPTGALDNNQYASDVDSGNDVNNYVKVPWEEYLTNENCIGISNKCWRIISINTDGSITIVRDQNESSQIFDNTVNTIARVTNNNYVNTYGYNDLLENVPTPGHLEEYRSKSQMYTYLYGSSGYQETKLKKYYSLLTTIDVCLNKVDDYAGINLITYITSPKVKDTCNIVLKSNIVAISPLKNKYVRLPYVEEYLNASSESTCTSDYQYQCRNQNFMYNRSYYWCINGYASYSWNVRFININGYANSNDPSNSDGVRPIVNLKSTILISGGIGSVLDPYVIKY